jgi:hypothetical protein
MFPIGLQFQAFKPVRKLPMRLETLSVEEQKRHFFKTLGMEYHKPLTQEKKRKLRKTRNKTKKI